MTVLAAKPRTRDERLLGERVRIDVRDRLHSDLLTMALRHASEELLRIDRRFNRQRDDSELTLLTTHQIHRRDASHELNALLDACAAMSVLTRGAFDISRGCPDEEIDPAAYVRGWAIDRAAAVLRHHGIENFCLGIGADVLVSGVAAPDRPWRAGVRDGRPGSPVRAVLTLHVDQPLRSIATVTGSDGGTTTVAASDMARASALAHAVSAWEGRGAPWTEQPSDVEVLRSSASGRLSGTSGMTSLLHW
jgi:thiamine biosynthesis lipoprotein